LFAAPIFLDTTSAMRWLPLISLFSGARVGEIVQLQTTDLRREGDTWFFNITEESDGQSVKSAAGVRRVPVHPELIRCGLLDYRKKLPKGQLFPTLKPGGPDRRIGYDFPGVFSKFRESLGITRKRLGFHSFRKNVTTCLDNAEGVQETDIQALIGHERGFTLDTYSGGLGLAKLQTIVERIQYPGLKLTHLRTN
jgi:integrase